MSGGIKLITKLGPRWVKKWRTGSILTRKKFPHIDLRPGASPPHPSGQLGGLALPVAKTRHPTAVWPPSPLTPLGFGFRISDFEFVLYWACVSAFVRRLSLTLSIPRTCPEKRRFRL